MTGMSLLQRLRKSKATVVRIVAPLLAVVWFGASASTCVAMVIAAPPVESAGVAAAHAGADAEHGEQHQTAVSHDQHHGSQAADEDHDRPSSSHGACPHCPGATGAAHDGTATMHVVCSAVSAFADGATAATVLKLDLKYAPTASVMVAAPVPGPAPSAILRAPPPPRCSVALNLRHCVFLI